MTSNTLRNITLIPIDRSAGNNPDGVALVAGVAERALATVDPQAPRGFRVDVMLDIDEDYAIDELDYSLEEDWPWPKADFRFPGYGFFSISVLYDNEDTLRVCGHIRDQEFSRKTDLNNPGAAEKVAKDAAWALAQAIPDARVDEDRGSFVRHIDMHALLRGEGLVDLDDRTPDA